MQDNPISPTIPLDKDGVHHGHLNLPHSHDDSAWGLIMIPICVIQNGKGPTALFTGANHGDEYEGPVALQNLSHELNPNSINGRVIIVPYFNFPAFLSATRTSPIDQHNMNRIFPGKPDGTVTQKIADYFQRTLLPQADIVLDFHSGGKTLDFVPFAVAHIQDNKDDQRACVAAMQAFNAPYSMMQLEIDNVGMYDTAAENMGKIFVSTELGGGGTSTARSVAIAKKGARNILIHGGILKEELVRTPSIQLHMPDDACFTFSDTEGLLEVMLDLGEQVEKGQPIARIWSKDKTGVPPQTYHAKHKGILAGRHFPGLVKSGDCIAVVAVEV